MSGRDLTSRAKVESTSALEMGGELIERKMKCTARGHVMTTLPLLMPGLMCDHAVWEPLRPSFSKLRACTWVGHGLADSKVKCIC
jgi:hypothetical protein